LLLAVHELFLLILKDYLRFPSLEGSGQLDTISLLNSALGKFTELSDAGVQSRKLGTKVFKEGLDLRSQHLGWNLAHVVEANLNNGFASVTKGTTEYWIVQDVAEGFIRD